MEASESAGLRELPDRPIDWRRALMEREDQARELIRAHPVATLLGAAAFGFLLARLVRELR
jgi:hypothetical protein